MYDSPAWHRYCPLSLGHDERMNHCLPGFSAQIVSCADACRSRPYSAVTGEVIRYCTGRQLARAVQSHLLFMCWPAGNCEAAECGILMCSTVRTLQHHKVACLDGGSAASPCRALAMIGTVEAGGFQGRPGNAPPNWEENMNSLHNSAAEAAQRVNAIACDRGPPGWRAACGLLWLCTSRD